MESSQKPRVPPPASREEMRRSVAERPPAITPGSDALSVAKASVKWIDTEGRPYWKLAFANPYNLSLLAGGLAASVLTLNPLLALATVGLEGLWMLHAPESGLLKRMLWDPRREKERRQVAEAIRRARLAALDPDARSSVEELLLKQEQIRTLASANPSFAGDLLRSELDKTDRLVEAYIDLSTTCARYETYLETVNEGRLNNDRQRLEKAVAAGKAGDPQTEIAKKNLEILGKRAAKIAEIRHYLGVARGQLDLIANSFQLITDQIVTMESPQELSGQLDELLDGVEAIQQTAVDAEKLLGS